VLTNRSQLITAAKTTWLKKPRLFSRNPLSATL